MGQPALLSSEIKNQGKARNKAYCFLKGRGSSHNSRFFVIFSTFVLSMTLSPAFERTSRSLWTSSFRGLGMGGLINGLDMNLHLNGALLSRLYD
jgi:hypothetical protein